MQDRGLPRISLEQAQSVLGISGIVGEEAIRAAYLEQVRQHPPDRDPEMFERIRDAYDLLRDSRRRARQVLEAPDPRAPLASLLEGSTARRQFVGPNPWLEVMKETRA